ncbi:MAG: hypothetical protein EBR38_08390 [Flavobacteriaceae bacterium]|nr:hypothetical protein [Flavobacteriaceae bacterium]
MKIFDELDLQIRTKIDGVFIIGTDKVAEAYLASDADLNDDTQYEWQSIMNGVLSMSLRRGVDTYTGAYPLPIINVGSLHVISTNQGLDPNQFKYLQPRSKIRLIRKDPQTLIFQGRVDNIFVDYRSDTQKPLISFDIMDPVGELQGTMTKLSGISTSADHDWSERISEILSNGGRTVSAGPKQLVRNIYGGTTSHGFWDENRTIWEALTLASNTEGGFIYFDKNNELNCYASEEIPESTPSIYFSNIDPDAVVYGFKNIYLDYNTQSIINQVQVSNSWGYQTTRYDQEVIGEDYGEWITVTEIETKAKGPYADEASINKHGTHALNVETNFNLKDGESELTSWANKIISKWKNPTTLVKEIEWNAKDDISNAAGIDILDSVSIEYQTETLGFTKELTVIGIQMEINADQDTWRVKYILFPRSRFI